MYAPVAVSSGAVVIDNSSRWRMDKDVPLVVPEINLADARGKKLVANPNCSTIQAALAALGAQGYGSSFRGIHHLSGGERDGQTRTGTRWKTRGRAGRTIFSVRIFPRPVCPK